MGSSPNVPITSSLLHHQSIIYNHPLSINLSTTVAV
uniref:Uncharacterized protein n=1 Tax=viral metagenome TaxID=1070528 RepID=A0A6C0BKT8_9ZZZZ